MVVQVVGQWSGTVVWDSKDRFFSLTRTLELKYTFCGHVLYETPDAYQSNLDI